ncbi:MAG: molecular chaperone TorD family protein [Bradyrhizobiaceae bacterium]|nr:molecular chaperone TorD family protein [Hyphomicrobiales bacterium]MBV9428938.1 molecular chaperone TorD family protein [Bradyrhizobiaceae bacterium]
MREPGLEEAIRVAGGVSELARRLGIAQPSVSNWERVPAERVASVEEATGVDRARLRPDLFAARAAAEIDDVDAARAQEYALLATLLARAPDRDLLARLARLKSDESPLGAAHAKLAEAAGAADAAGLEREYFNLFLGVGRGEVLPYGSYYLTGFLHERPLARLRSDLAGLGIERAEEQCEPEDHIAILCEVMAGLAGGRFTVDAGDERRRAEKQFFHKHLAPWARRFFADLERAEAADFYRAVAAVGTTFIDIETQAFALPS